MSEQLAERGLLQVLECEAVFFQGRLKADLIDRSHHTG